MVTTFGGWNTRMIEYIRNEMKEVNLRVKMLSNGDTDQVDLWHDELALFLKDIERRPPKAIILVGDESWIVFQHLMQGRTPQTPIILCGVKEYSTSFDHLLEEGPVADEHYFYPIGNNLEAMNAFAVIEPVEVRNVVDMMVTLRPDMEQFALMTLSKHYGSYVRFLTQSYLASNYPQIELKHYDSNRYTTSEMVEELKSMDRKTGVAIGSWSLRRSDSVKSINNLYELFADHAPSPLFMLGYAPRAINFVAGGDFPDNRATASTTVTLLHQLLAGKVPEQRIFNPTSRHLHLNASELSRWGISRSEAPSDTRYYNEATDLFHQYAFEFWVGFFFLLLLLFLAFEEYRRKLRHGKMLIEHNALLAEAKSNAEEAKRQAQEASQLKSLFLANMSHEIRTPLNAIVGFSNLLVEGELDCNEKSHFGSVINENSQLLLRLINDLLDLSKIESGAVGMTLKLVDLNQLIRRCCDTQQINWKSEATLLDELPEESLQIHTDEMRLQQVIHNLLSNAHKHTHKGHVRIGYHMGKEHITLYVKDSGNGIPQEHLGDIFNRFFKATTTVQGTGLGLTIAKSLVERLGGVIGVESTVGKGSHFYFTHPLNHSVERVEKESGED